MKSKRIHVEDSLLTFGFSVVVDLHNWRWWFLLREPLLSWCPWQMVAFDICWLVPGPAWGWSQDSEWLVPVGLLGWFHFKAHGFWVIFASFPNCHDLVITSHDFPRFFTYRVFQDSKKTWDSLTFSMCRGLFPSRLPRSQHFPMKSLQEDICSKRRSWRRSREQRMDQSPAPNMCYLDSSSFTVFFLNFCFCAGETEWNGRKWMGVEIEMLWVGSRNAESSLFIPYKLERSHSSRLLGKISNEGCHFVRLKASSNHLVI